MHNMRCQKLTHLDKVAAKKMFVASKLLHILTPSPTQYSVC